MPPEFKTSWARLLGARSPGGKLLLEFAMPPHKIVP
jgi:hypothetical protein